MIYRRSKSFRTAESIFQRVRRGSWRPRPRPSGIQAESKVVCSHEVKYRLLKAKSSSCFYTASEAGPAQEWRIERFRFGFVTFVDRASVHSVFEKKKLLLDGKEIEVKSAFKKIEEQLGVPPILPCEESCKVFVGGINQVSSVS